jgi:hypothetical protein
VVTQRHGVKFELVKCLGDLLAPVVGVEERALELVAGVQPQVIRVLLAQLGDLGLDARIATVAALFWVVAACARGGELVQVRVDIVNVEERYAGQLGVLQGKAAP